MTSEKVIRENIKKLRTELGLTQYVSASLFFIACFSSILFLFSKADAQVTSLNVNGSCPDSTPATPLCNDGTTYRTIQGAIDAASRGQTILVAPGAYNEYVLLNKVVAIEGANVNTTILRRPTGISRPAIVEIRETGGVATLKKLKIEGDFTTLTAAIYIHLGGRAQIEGNIIKGPGLTDGRGGTALRIGDRTGATADATIKDNRILDFGGKGIRVEGAGNKAIISNNEIIGAGPSRITNPGTVVEGQTFIKNGQTGIDVEYNALANISGNTIQGFGYRTFPTDRDPIRARCISFSNINVPPDADWYKIENNTLTNCQAGIWIYGNRGFTGAITNNTTSNDGVFEGEVAYLASSVAVMLRGGTVTAENNIFNGISWVTIGFWFHGSQYWSPPMNSKAALRNNRLNGFKDAIRLDNAYNTPTIKNNSFTANGTAIRLCYNTALDVRSNWWGNASGPAHPSNPQGTGGKLYNASTNCSGTGSGTFSFQPWLTSDLATTTPITISGASPSPAYAGSELTLSGSGFETGSTVVFNGNSLTPNDISPDGKTIRFTIPTVTIPGKYQVYVSIENRKSNEIQVTVSKTILEPGTMQVEAVTSPPRALTIPAGAKNVPIAGIQVSARGEDIMLSKIALRLNETEKQVVEKIAVWHRGQKVAETGPESAVIEIPEMLLRDGGEGREFTITVDVSTAANLIPLTLQYAPERTSGVGQRSRVRISATGVAERAGKIMRVGPSDTPMLSLYIPDTRGAPGENIAVFHSVNQYEKVQLRYVCPNGIKTAGTDLCNKGQVIKTSGIQTVEFENTTGQQQIVRARLRALDPNNEVLQQHTLQITVIPPASASGSSVLNLIAGIVSAPLDVFQEILYDIGNKVQDFMLW
ncbi:MAG: right-handed parallel beta-helix repeat-containing protein [Parcubacteria group bacterium]|nr:right-handed parallel beta-helix repeat-containing protein [Parcubacteria group bacterium]